MSTTSLKRQEEVLPMAKLEQRRYNVSSGEGKCAFAAKGHISYYS